MIDEPYRWLEAVANRREYIQDQLKGGSPIIVLAYDNGLLLATIGREHQKIFEVYDRVAFSAIGHPADIEKLRMVGIDMAHVEGFTRAIQDVSLRRIVNFGVSPAIKSAFEQIFAAPYIARVFFTELGESPEDDLVCKIDYDGSFQLKSGAEEKVLFDAIAGSAQLESAILNWLRGKIGSTRPTRDEALELALEAWIVAKHTTIEASDEKTEIKLPENFDARKALREEVKTGTIEAAVLDRSRPEDAKFSRLSEKEFRDVLK
jgi:proteasome alpha subunit